MTLDQLLAKMAESRDFRVQLLTDPKTALESAGVTPTPEMISALRGLDRDSLENVAKAFASGAHPDMC